MRIEGHIDAARVARAFKRSPRIMIDRVDAFLLRGALELAREARREAPKASSLLANSIYPDKLGDMDYLIGPHVAHGVYMELGRRPGGAMPPFQPILDWLKNKGVASLSGEEPRDVAWAMRRSIQRKGTPAQPFMGPALARMEDRLIALALQGVNAGLRSAGLA